MDEKTRTELEAAAFRRLVAHLRARTDVQNIDMMNLAGFCRNCLGDWYREAAAEKGIKLEKDQAREIVYGMPPAEWKKRHQKEASAEQQAQFAQAVTAEAGQVHHVDVLHVGARAQMRHQAPESGSFQFGAGFLVHGRSFRGVECVPKR